jgi:hypothetical protein
MLLVMIDGVLVVALYVNDTALLDIKVDGARFSNY